MSNPPPPPPPPPRTHTETQILPFLLPIMILQILPTYLFHLIFERAPFVSLCKPVEVKTPVKLRCLDPTVTADFYFKRGISYFNS